MDLAAADVTWHRGKFSSDNLEGLDAQILQSPAPETFKGTSVLWMEFQCIQYH